MEWLPAYRPLGRSPRGVKQGWVPPMLTTEEWEGGTKVSACRGRRHGTVLSPGSVWGRRKRRLAREYLLPLLARRTQDEMFSAS